MKNINKIMIVTGLIFSIASALIQHANITPAYAETITVTAHREHHIPIQKITWTPRRAKNFIKDQAKLQGWTGRKWQCLSEIVWRESRFMIHADNHHSTAYGLFQVLGTPKDTPIDIQVKQGFRYINHRYDGDPCQALAHHNRNGWY